MLAEVLEAGVFCELTVSGDVPCGIWIRFFKPGIKQSADLRLGVPAFVELIGINKILHGCWPVAVAI